MPPSGLRQRLIQIGNEIIDMLDPHREPNRLLPYPGLRQLLGRQLPKRRLGGGGLCHGRVSGWCWCVQR